MTKTKLLTTVLTFFGFEFEQHSKNIQRSTSHFAKENVTQKIKASNRKNVWLPGTRYSESCQLRCSLRFRRRESKHYATTLLVRQQKRENTTMMKELSFKEGPTAGN